MAEEGFELGLCSLSKRRQPLCSAGSLVQIVLGPALESGWNFTAQALRGQWLREGLQARAEPFSCFGAAAVFSSLLELPRETSRSRAGS